jgi:hypothetical protein
VSCGELGRVLGRSYVSPGPRAPFASPLTNAGTYSEPFLGGRGTARRCAGGDLGFAMAPVADIDGVSIDTPATLAVAQLSATLIDGDDVEAVFPAGGADGGRMAL